MTTQAQDAVVRTEIMVDVPVEHAFAEFTARTVTWKPPDHNLLKVEIAETVFEAHEGGHIYDRGVDGSECRWARVVALDPPNRLVFNWLINPRWQIDTDLSRASEVEVRFISEGAERTRVVLEHRNLERHGDGWESMRDAVAAPDGWPIYLQRFAGDLST